MSYAVMPMADFKNICDKVREKTETIEAIKSGDMTGKVEEVYKAGQLSVFSSSEALKGKAEGNPVTITDISHVEHNVEVKLLSDTLTDFSGVKVTVGGTNLFDISQVKDSAYLTNNGDGTLTISGIYGCGTGVKLSELCPTLKAGDVARLRLNTEGNPVIYLNVSKFTWNSGVIHTITEEDLNSVVNVYGKTDKGTYTISQIWLYFGTETLPYEPYVGHTEYTAKAAGTVENVKSVYPTTMMYTNTEGVNISVEYYKDIDKVLENLVTSIALSGGE